MYHVLLSTKDIIERRQDKTMLYLESYTDLGMVGWGGGGGVTDRRLIKYKQTEDHHVGYI